MPSKSFGNMMAITVLGGLIGIGYGIAVSKHNDPIEIVAVKRYVVPITGNGVIKTVSTTSWLNMKTINGTIGKHEWCVILRNYEYVVCVIVDGKAVYDTTE